MEKLKMKKRCDELFKLGMKFSFKYNSYVGAEDGIKDFNIHTNEILFDSEEEWNSKIKKLKNEITRRKSNALREKI